MSGETVWVTGAWYLAAMLACLSVLLINGTPLYYFDTGGYLAQGEQFLKLVGLVQDAQSGGNAGGGAAEAASDKIRTGAKMSGIKNAV